MKLDIHTTPILAETPHARRLGHRLACCAALLVAGTWTSRALADSSATRDAPPSPGRLTLLTGLQQPILLRGANVAATFRFANGAVLETSFGFGLTYDHILSDEDKMDFDHVGTPITGGFGVGYSRHGFSLLFEPKATHFVVTPKGTDDERKYTTFTLGAGLYYDWRIWKGLVLQPTLKFWPKVASTLDGGEATLRRGDGSTFVHEARTPGNSGFIFGASLGWAFEF